MITLYRLIDTLFWIMNAAILLRVLFSWIRLDPYNPLVRLIGQITEPILAPLRRVMPTFGGLDITPMVALIILDFVRRVVLALLF